MRNSVPNEKEYLVVLSTKALMNATALKPIAGLGIMVIGLGNGISSRSLGHQGYECRRKCLLGQFAWLPPSRCNTS